MINKKYITIERILGEIDNDFNFDNSDWIPRVATWCINSLGQMRLLETEFSSKVYEVHDRMIQLDCPFHPDKIKVFDENGCEIKKFNKNMKCYCQPKIDNNIDSNKYDPTFINGVLVVTTDPKDVKDFNDISKVISPKIAIDDYFIIASNNKIELSIDHDYVTIEVETIKIQYSDNYNSMIPLIRNDENLIDALKWYCVWKTLGRGTQHPIYNLNGNDAVNPYKLWLQAKERAVTSIKIDNANANQSDGWNNFFYNSTFLPRHK